MTNHIPKVNDYVKWTTALGMVHEDGYIIKEQMIMRRELKIHGFQYQTTSQLR